MSSINSVITSKDILFGRGAVANQHSGNKIYRKLIAIKKDLYRQSTPLDQKLLVRSIFATFEREGFRFVRMDDESKQWEEVHEDDAMDKIRQSFRESPEKKQKKSSSGTAIQEKRSPEPPLPLQQPCTPVEYGHHHRNIVSPYDGDGLSSDDSYSLENVSLDGFVDIENNDTHNSKSVRASSAFDPFPAQLSHNGTNEFSHLWETNNHWDYHETLRQDANDKITLFVL